jgi:hypothetical protein
LVPLVIDLAAETSGAKRNAAALSKKKQLRMNGRDAPEAAIRWSRMANHCGSLNGGTNYTFRSFPCSIAAGHFIFFFLSLAILHQIKAKIKHQRRQE